MHLREELNQIGLELCEVGIEAGSSLVGLPFGDVETSVAGCVVVAIKQFAGTIIWRPTAGVILAEGDIFVLIGRQDALPDLRQSAKKREKHYYRGAVV